MQTEAVNMLDNDTAGRLIDILEHAPLSTGDQVGRTWIWKAGRGMSGEHETYEAEGGILRRGTLIGCSLKVSLRREGRILCEDVLENMLKLLQCDLLLPNGD